MKTLNAYWRLDAAHPWVFIESRSPKYFDDFWYGVQASATHSRVQAKISLVKEGSEKEGELLAFIDGDACAGPRPHKWDAPSPPATRDQTPTLKKLPNSHSKETE